MKKSALTKTLRRSALTQSLFLRLPRPVARAVYAFARDYLFPDKRRTYFEQVFSHIRTANVPGDYLEFGVYRGTSFIACYKAARREKLHNKMRFFAFDSFEGLPNAEGAVFKKGDFRCPEEHFSRIVSQAGVHPARVEIVKGLYDRSLTAETKRVHALTQAAVVHVDCDLYTSTKTVLAFVEDLIDVGTILIFDDWHSYRRHGNEAEYGEQKAFAEWPLADRFDMFYDVPSDPAAHCRAFVMARPAREPGGNP